EYQAKAILRKFGVPVPDGHVVYNGNSAREWAKRLGPGPWVVKAQIHAGGRGKGGGVKLAKTSEEVRTLTRDMLGMVLRTHQTGPDGKVVTRVLVENGCNIDRELYVSLVVDRTSAKVTLMASTEGGMDIEDVAASTPEKIFVETIDPLVGLTGFQSRNIALKLGLGGKLLSKAAKVLGNLYNTFIACDCSMLEINPLVVTKEDTLLALDAKFGFDDNAIFRHLQISDMRDYDEEDPQEVEASQHDLSYISLDGNIGCLVNGAGLAMATMDIVKHNGGEPANFLDVGGGATVERVTEAFKLILSDSKVKGILVNIFGGIMKCDVIAAGVIEAAQQVSLQVPLVVRLEGTNVEMGKKLLDESGLNIIAADGMADAARKIVQAVA
ncbi:MAG: ADP-forming succinate--CoA ligase subunit beta, partial [Deltaproteobacteria bacterium]|nr:ADP-forming succinate--CoA ligase subunit beta [Deltaproteobacteria bacterium]